MTMMDSVEHGVMRVVFAAPGRAKKVLSRLNMTYNETEVLCVNLANKAGALAAVAERLAKNHINISYAYCTAGAKGGRTTGILKVADVKKAIKILQKNQLADRTHLYAKRDPQYQDNGDLPDLHCFSKRFFYYCDDLLKSLFPNNKPKTTHQ